MSTTPEPPDQSYLTDLINPNGTLNHPLYYRLLKTIHNETSSSPTLNTPFNSLDPTLAPLLHRTALRYLLSDLSHSDAYAMDLLVNPQTGEVDRELYWVYTFKVHQAGDTRALARLTEWAREHSEFLGGEGEVSRGREGGGEARVDAAKGRGEGEVDEVRGSPGSEQRGERAGVGSGFQGSEGLWRAAVLPFTNFAAGPIEAARGEDWLWGTNGTGNLRSPPPYES
ncbi:hypothetical protein MBLNU230_g2418t1 [Neophaeotheca triangularis]